jgi:rare lipoprotein A (peptidoglycan hydrolase)
MKALTFVLAGWASWFNPGSMYGDSFVCAMNALPPSTRIVIVDDENGRESPCVVVGTGPFVRGRILDVSPSVAKRLGFYSAGLAHVRVYRIIRVRAHRTLVHPVTIWKGWP